MKAKKEKCLRRLGRGAIAGYVAEKNLADPPCRSPVPKSLALKSQNTP
jgi:hypothetical protein